MTESGYEVDAQAVAGAILARLTGAALAQEYATAPGSFSEPTPAQPANGGTTSPRSRGRRWVIGLEGGRVRATAGIAAAR